MKTDSIRFFLYILLGFIVFMLWNTWQREYGAPPVVTSSTAPQTQTTATPANITAPTTDISEQTGKLVQVKTDVLNLTINTLGGTIVKSELTTYPENIKFKNTPFTLLNDDDANKYIAQSGLVDANHQEQSLIFQTSQTQYDLKPDENTLAVTLTAMTKTGLQVTKQFVFERGKYAIKVHYTFDNKGSNTWQGNLYSQLERRWPTVQSEQSSGLMRSLTTYTGTAISTPTKLFKKIDFKSIKNEGVDAEMKGGWAAMLQQYFISTWIAPQDQNTQYYSRTLDNNLYVIGMLGPKMVLAPGQTLQNTYQFYTGPELTSNLQGLAPGLELTIDYGWFWYFSIAIFWLLQWIYKYVGNWGWSIVLVTVVIKGLLYKLSAMSYQSMANMRKLQPKLQALKERYAEDKQQFSRAMMELYRKEKINPLGGCWPVLIQIPVFIALYWVLVESVQLRQAPFILWIHDLSAPDPSHLLPILMCATMLLQQKLSPPPPDPTQAKIMMMLPMVFLVLFWSFPAGLLLYWVVNNALSILQQWYITRSVEGKP